MDGLRCLLWSHPDRPHEPACRQSMDEPMIFCFARKTNTVLIVTFVQSQGEKIFEGFGENCVPLAERERGTESNYLRPLNASRSTSLSNYAGNLSFMDRYEDVLESNIYTSIYYILLRMAITI